MSSKTTNMSLNSLFEGGSMMRLISTISGCRKSLSNLTSLKMRIASELCSKTSWIFFMATFSPV
uniref:Mitogen-activated protein kinase n=1 Tax=Rhizophora mucronata TaxID=61149 RepID=A0A2P2MJW4_RHIMU